MVFGDDTRFSRKASWNWGNVVNYQLAKPISDLNESRWFRSTSCLFIVPVTGGQPTSSRGRVQYAFIMSRLTPPSSYGTANRCVRQKYSEASVPHIRVTVMVNETRCMVVCLDLTYLQTL